MEATLAPIELNPRDAMKIGGDYLHRKQLTEAEDIFRQIIKHEPQDLSANSALAITLIEQGRCEEALPILDYAASIAREELLALSCNRGKAMADMGRSHEALAVFDQILASVPGHTFAVYSRGLVFLQLGRCEDAIVEFNKVLAKHPGHHSSRFGRAFANLVLGNYLEGFADYECRRKDEIIEPRSPLWTGDQDIAGKKVLVYGDQGLGDNVMFGRYVPLMIERGADISLWVPPVVRPLFAHLPVKLLDDKRLEWRDDCDYWVRGMSLAYCFRTTVETIPPPLPLNLPPKPNSDGKPRVGLCWSGSRKSMYDKFRSIPLRALEPILRMPGLRFYALQHDVRETDQEAFAEFKDKYGLQDLTPWMGDFQKSAHVLNSLDAVVSCDTGLAHLAGTVGVPTHVGFTSFRTYWLWIQKLTHSPWYPSIKVYRQKEHFNWEPVVGQISGALA